MIKARFSSKRLFITLLILAVMILSGLQCFGKINQVNAKAQNRKSRIYIGYDNEIWAINTKSGHYECVRKNKEKVYGPSGNLTRVGNYLYYDQSGPNEKGWWICRYDLNKGKEEHLALGSRPDISGGKIYYSSLDKKSENQSIEDDEPMSYSGIGCMNLDGSEQKQICQYRPGTFIRNGKIYLFDEYKLYGVDTSKDALNELASFNKNSDDIEIEEVWSIKDQLYINYIDFTTRSKTDPKANNYAMLSRYNSKTGKVTDLGSYFRYNSGEVIYEILDAGSKSAIVDVYYGTKEAQKKNKALGEVLSYTYRDGKTKSLFKMKDRDYFSFYFMNNRFAIGEMKLKSGKNVLSIYDRKKQVFNDIP